MASTSLKKKLIGMLIIIVLVLTIISIGVIYPAIKKIGELKDNIAKIQNEMEQKYENSQKLRRTMRELEKTETEVIKFTEATAKLGDELKIITELENLALKHSVDQTLNVSYSGGNSKVKKVSIEYYELSFLNNAYFENHIKYLNDLEKLPYYVIVKSIKLEKRQGNTINNHEKTPVTLSFNAKIYVTVQ